MISFSTGKLRHKPYFGPIGCLFHFSTACNHGSLMVAAPVPMSVGIWNEFVEMYVDTTEGFPIAGLGTYYLDWLHNYVPSLQNHGFERLSILPVGDICLPMVGKHEPITGLYQNFIKFTPNSNRLRGRSANHQGSGPYNQGCVFPFVYKGKEDKDFLRYGRNT